MNSLEFFHCVKKKIKNVEYINFDQKKNEMRKNNLHQTEQNKYTHACINVHIG